MPDPSLQSQTLEPLLEEDAPRQQGPPSRTGSQLSQMMEQRRRTRMGSGIPMSIPAHRDAFSGIGGMTSSPPRDSTVDASRRPSFSLCVNVPQLSSYENVDAVLLQAPPTTMFPNADALQEMERKDREWLEYRRTWRQAQEQEDLLAYQTRLEARQHQFLYETAGDGLDDSKRLLCDADRTDLNVLVCVDEKKGHEHGQQLSGCVQQILHEQNTLHLLNCFSKGKAPEQNKGHMATIQRDVRGNASLSKTNIIPVVKEVDGMSKGEYIIEYVDRNKIGFIVLGMKEEKKSFFETKVSTDLINACPEGKAVLMIPAGVTFNVDKGRRILMAYDGTPNCREAVVAMSHLLRQSDTVVLFQVVTPAPKLVVVKKANDMATLQPNPKYNEILQTRVREAETALEHVKSSLIASLAPGYINPDNITTEYRVLDPDKKKTVVDFIAGVAQQSESELLVMAARAITGWQSLSQSKYKRSLLIVK